MKRKKALGSHLASGGVTADQLGLSAGGKATSGKASKAAAPAKLTTPFRDLLPELTADEMEALRASVKAEGVRVPVLVDQHGRVLDGHHRLSLDPNAPRRTVHVNTDAEARAIVVNANYARRNLTAEQREQLRTRLQAIARALRKEGKTQAEAARHIGVPRATLAAWEREALQNVGGNITQRQDARRKVSRSAIARRLKAGEKPADVARSLGVNRSTVTRAGKAKPKPTRAVKVKRCPACGQVIRAKR